MRDPAQLIAIKIRRQERLSSRNAVLSQQIVVLVLVSNIRALKGLLLLLDARFRVIIHLDAKANAEDCDLPLHASFTGTRFEVFWGGFNIMLAIREMIDTAYRIVPGFVRAVMITGDTLPLLSNDRIEEALLKEHQGYVGLYEVPDDNCLRGLTMEHGNLQAGWNVMAWRFQNATCLAESEVTAGCHAAIRREREHCGPSTWQRHETCQCDHSALAASTNPLQQILLWRILVGIDQACT